MNDLTPLAFDPRNHDEREYFRRLERHLAAGGGQQPAPQMKKISDFPEWGAEDDLYEDPFWYVFNQLGNIAPAGTSSQNIQIQGDSKFEWMQTTAFYLIAAEAAQPSFSDKANLSVFFSDTGTGRNLSNAPMPLNSVAGTGQLVYVLPVTRIFQPNSTVQCTVVNADAAITYNNVSVVMSGRKIFKGRQGA
jgi:hypothetical protein